MVHVGHALRFEFQVNGESPHRVGHAVDTPSGGGAQQWRVGKLQSAGWVQVGYDDVGLESGAVSGDDSPWPLVVAVYVDGLLAGGDGSGILVARRFHRPRGG